MKLILNFLLFSFFLLFSTYGNAQLTITEIGTLPEPVSNNAVCEGFIDGVPYLFSFAGIDTTKIFSGTHLKSFRMNLETGESERIDDLPGDQGLLATGASRIGNIIYIVGGYTVNANGSEVTSRKVRRYDIENNEFLSDAADLIVPTDDHVQAVWRDSLLYVVTGWSNSANIRFTQVYDPISDNWTNGTLLPNDNNYTSFGASGAIVDDKIYYFGGARSTGNFPIQNYLRVGEINPDDPSEVTWTISQPDADINGYRMAATMMDDQVHWIGGSNNTYNYNGIAYDGSGGVPTANQELVFVEGLEINRFEIDNEVPMDLRGIAKISETEQYIAGGMLANQQVTDKVFKLELKPLIVIPAVSYTAADLGINIFPNPVVDQINIVNEGKEKIESYNIYDNNGKLILNSVFNSSIAVGDIIPGIYFIELILQSGKKVKERIQVGD